VNLNIEKVLDQRFLTTSSNFSKWAKTTSKGKIQQPVWKTNSYFISKTRQLGQNNP